MEFHRSAGTNVPLARGNGYCSAHIFLDGGTRTARVRAAVSVAMPGAQRHGRRRYISFPRLPRARGEFTTELAPPLTASLSTMTTSLSPSMAEMVGTRRRREAARRREKEIKALSALFEEAPLPSELPRGPPPSPTHLHL